MIYTLLKEYLKNDLMGQPTQINPFTLVQISGNQLRDQYGCIYQVENIDIQNDIEVIDYQFHYEFDVNANQILSMICILFNNDFKTQTINLMDQKDHQLPLQLIKRSVIKSEKINSSLKIHELINLLPQKIQVLNENSTNNIIIQQQVKEPKFREDDPEKLQNKQKQHKQHKQIKVKSENILSQKKEKKSKQKALTGTPYIKWEKLAQRLNIPENWKVVAESYGILQEKVWEIKYYEQLVLLAETISKKNLYNYLSKQKMEIETQKKLAKFTLPPDLTDPTLHKKRKIYNRDVICSLIE